MFLHEHTVLWGAAVDGGRGERKNNADTALFLSNGSPGSLPLRAFMCSQSVFHYRTWWPTSAHTYWARDNHLSVCLLPYLSDSFWVHLSVCHVTCLYTCRISVLFGKKRLVLWYTGSAPHIDRVLIPVAAPCVPIDTVSHVRGWEASEGSCTSDAWAAYFNWRKHSSTVTLKPGFEFL